MEQTGTVKQTDIEKTIRQFMAPVKKDIHHRYKSWEHCYSFFRKHKMNLTQQGDLACLQLAFFLASWGMLRGSSFLLQKDFKIYKKIIRVIASKEYNALWDPEIKKQDNMRNTWRLIEKFRLGISKAFNELKPVKGKTTNPSDTLITKIILGTFCCTPAYDQYFRVGLQKAEKTMGDEKIPAKFGEKSYLKLINFYIENKDDIEKMRKMTYRKQKIKYPIMKIIDMYFWQKGRPINK